MDTLPTEVISEILTNLPHSDLKCARLLSRKFYKASLVPEITKKDKFVYNQRKQKSSLLDYLNMLSNPDRKLYNFEFTCANVSDQLETIIDKHGRIIESLSFVSCIIEPVCFAKYLFKCVNLKSLMFDECRNSFDELFCPRQLSICLPSVENLSVTLNDESAEVIYNDVKAIFPNVKHLKLVNNGIFFHKNSIQGLSAYIYGASGQLESIDLSADPLTDSVLNAIADINFANLKALNFSSHCLFSAEDIECIVKKQPQLEILKFQSTLQLPDQFFRDIIRFLRNLKVLSIEGCTVQSLNGLTSLLALNTGLRSLSFPLVRMNNFIPEANMTPDILDDTSLTELNFAKLLSSSIYASWIAHSFTKLTRLDLSYSRMAVYDDVLQIICRNLKHLKVLRIPGSTNLTDKGFGLSNDKCPRVSFCKSLNYLEELDLARCYGVTDITIQNYLWMPSLRSLNLYGCSHISIDSLESLVDRCPHLELLNIGGTNTGNESVLKIVSGLGRLSTLILYDCIYPSSEILERLIDTSDFLTTIVLNRNVYRRSVAERQFYMAESQFFSLEEELYQDATMSF